MTMHDIFVLLCGVVSTRGTMYVMGYRKVKRTSKEVS